MEVSSEQVSPEWISLLLTWTCVCMQVHTYTHTHTLLGKTSAWHACWRLEHFRVKMQAHYVRPALLWYQKNPTKEKPPRESSQERETPPWNSLIQPMLKLFPNTSQQVPFFRVLRCPANPDLPLWKPDLWGKGLPCSDCCPLGSISDQVFQPCLTNANAKLVAAPRAHTNTHTHTHTHTHAHTQARARACVHARTYT